MVLQFDNETVMLLSYCVYSTYRMYPHDKELKDLHCQFISIIVNDIINSVLEDDKK